MPYRWTDDEGRHALTAWPYRSLPRRGFVWVIGATAAALALPLMAVVGTAILWGLLPFAALTVAGMWWAFERTYRSGETHEVLTFDRERLHLRRSDRGQADREWQANPYWVRATLRGDGPVTDYLTLTDGGREVEVGAFLTPEERRALWHEMRTRLAGLR